MADKDKSEREKGYEDGKKGDYDFSEIGATLVLGSTEYGKGYDAGKNDRDDDK